MKGTRHNGRSGKDGVYNPLHNDRRFDPEHSEHIDNERVRQNIYWDCYQGYTTMADRGKEDNFSFNQIEMAYYVDHYSDYVINQNKRHEKARHPDRCALPGFVDSKNEEKTERNAGYLVVSQSGGGMLRQGTRKGIRRTPANRGMRAHRIVKGLDISEDVCHGMCP